ncbi:hypothetical protein LCGC14_1533910 [marine sediment metagenome]|uniref:Uncharacterized protein n=1 Tax=marine sediment metagenome TaxID=412755 RepID=A0A0F9IV53_9ZZZZ|nr:hypothetical protein [archaeon]
MSDVSLVENDLFYLLEIKKHKKLAKNIGNMIIRSEIPLNEIYDMIGELLKKNSEYFMDSVYPLVRTQIRKIPSSQMREMDEHILKKFCFLEGEVINVTFLGSISEKKVNSFGRIYLTNYRLIVCGTQVVRSAQSKGFGPGRPGLIGMAFRSGITRRRKAVRKAITKTLRRDIDSLNLAEWGYYFPMHEAYKIKTGKKNISYSITIETDKKPIVMSITITPSRLKKQTKEEFLNYKNSILSQIYELLFKFQ